MAYRVLKSWAGLFLMGVAGFTGITAIIAGTSMQGQALPTATQTVDLSVFGAGTGTFTELDQSRNAGITVGADLAVKTYYNFRPAIELRGTYPFDSGSVVGLKSVMIGPRVSRSFGRFTPYVDAFFGRGAMTYQNGGIIVNNFRYDRTTTNIYGGGGGVDYRLTPRFDGKVDVQFQRWGTPVVVPDQKIYPIPISIGLVYHFDFNGRRGHYKAPKPARRNSKLPQYN